MRLYKAIHAFMVNVVDKNNEMKGVVNENAGMNHCIGRKASAISRFANKWRRCGTTTRRVNYVL